MRPLINRLIKIINFLGFLPGGRELFRNNSSTQEISQAVLQLTNRYCLMIFIQMGKLIKTSNMKMIQLSYRISEEQSTKRSLFAYYSYR